MSAADNQRRYERSAKGLATMRRYRTSEKGRARRQAAARRSYLRNREATLARMKKYDNARKEQRRLYDKARPHRGVEISFWVTQAREAM